jgi:hypothetical protein
VNEPLTNRALSQYRAQPQWTRINRETARVAPAYRLPIVHDGFGEPSREWPRPLFQYRLRVDDGNNFH